MNNLMLSFAGADLTRLRALVAAVEKEITLVPGSAKPAGSESPKTALDVTWSNLVAMLDLGPEPEMRECPACRHLCALGATRCGHCWTSLPVLNARAQTSA